ncbi:Uncharacterised protein [Mycobacterium tuberculosis]|uniref:Uncharacterized protein n=1 Tax=Mycobacterium tuberculosis TaxID=1773 RepID=A0A0U0SYB0_MYCTX|nr:Uncharacterised protein [Mycobacterium tuberculosis]COX10594.1 Uncharacterised protein [Mycobacterium tuberculosis]COX11997.1 Uncharacterised protein [Mycobacterium tuberculosis]
MNFSRSSVSCSGRSSCSLVRRARLSSTRLRVSVRVSSARSRRFVINSLTVAKARSAAPSAASNGALMSSMFEFSAMGIPFINYFLISAFLHLWSGRWGKRRLLQGGLVKTRGLTWHATCRGNLLIVGSVVGRVRRCQAQLIRSLHVSFAARHRRSRCWPARPIGWISLRSTSPR